MHGTCGRHPDRPIGHWADWSMFRSSKGFFTEETSPSVPNSFRTFTSRSRAGAQLLPAVTVDRGDPVTRVLHGTGLTWRKPPRARVVFAPWRRVWNA